MRVRLVVSIVFVALVCAIGAVCGQLTPKCIRSNDTTWELLIDDGHLGFESSCVGYMTLDVEIDSFQVVQNNHDHCKDFSLSGQTITYKCDCKEFLGCKDYGTTIQLNTKPLGLTLNCAWCT